MKPEEQVRADFEAWMISEGCHSSDLARVRDSYSSMTMQIRYSGYRAGYAQARREALEEAAECLRLHAIGHFTLLEAERALEQLIKD